MQTIEDTTTMTARVYRVKWDPNSGHYEVALNGARKGLFPRRGNAVANAIHMAEQDAEQGLDAQVVSFDKGRDSHEWPV